MPSFTSQREHAQRDADCGYQRCLKAAQSRRAISPEQLIVGSGGKSSLNADGYQRLADAREQHAHFRGQVYTSVRPIAQRIAGQPIRLARIARRSRRRGAEARHYLLPDWVRDLAAAQSSRHAPRAVAASHGGWRSQAGPFLVYALLFGLISVGAALSPLRKRRTRQHVIADLSFNYVERLILRCGWAAQRMSPDYGIDLYMETYGENGEIENDGVWFQLKTTENIKPTKRRTIPVRLEWRDLLYWLNEWRLGILVIYDATQDRAWWLHLQQALRAVRLKISEPPAETVTFSHPIGKHSR